VAQRSFFGTVRLAILLVVLAFVALGAWLDRRRSTDWDAPLRVTVYPLAAEPAAAAYAAGLDEADFDAIEAFFAEEASRHGVTLEEPVRVRMSRAPPGLPPMPPRGAGPLGVAAWSLHLRWWAWRVAANDPSPPPDVQVFALFYAPDGSGPVPDSLGLSKGLVAIAHLYAAAGAAGSNRVVLAHELLHTLGATDKYDRATGQPVVPDGLGDPAQSPRYPQHYGEIMAGRIAANAREASVPDDLSRMLVGPATAEEIGWTR
jgi:hypothetical protein